MNHLLNNTFRWAMIVGVCATVAGCATARRPARMPGIEKPAAIQKGVYHKVSKGETLWRIAKTYKVTIDDIIQANNIPNAASIEENQLLLIPGAEAVQTVVLARDSAGKEMDYLWPVKGKIMSYFQDRKGAALNPGIDIKGVEGEIVKASREGKVVFADYLAGYGQTVILEHSDGFFTVYGHNESLFVKLGDFVFQGDKVAQISPDDTMAFMHFEVRKGDMAKNPLHYLSREM